MSKRIKGTAQMLLAALAERDFPQPGIPTSSMPRGMGSLNSRALRVNALPRIVSQSFRFSSPPTSLAVWGASKNSRMPVLRTARAFSLSTSLEIGGRFFLSLETLSTTALASAFSASTVVSPMAAWTIRSRSSSGIAPILALFGS